MNSSFCFFFNDTATTEIYTLSLHDALPISSSSVVAQHEGDRRGKRDAHGAPRRQHLVMPRVADVHLEHQRSEEHTSELQSLAYLVCRLLLEKKKKKKT